MERLTIGMLPEDQYIPIKDRHPLDQAFPPQGQDYDDKILRMKVESIAKEYLHCDLCKEKDTCATWEIAHQNIKDILSEVCSKS
jgi:hypothetical protein